MTYYSLRELSASEYSYYSARLLRRAILVLGFGLALILAVLMHA